MLFQPAWMPVGVEKYVAEHKSGEGGHLFEQGKLTDGCTTLV